MDDKVKICFDKDYKIKALDPEKFQRGEDLEKECGVFTDKISAFGEKVNGLVNILEQHAAKIDNQKLKVRGNYSSS
jgi:Intraflagellar transport complex B, subunit 20